MSKIRSSFNNNKQNDKRNKTLMNEEDDQNQHRHCHRFEQRLNEQLLRLQSTIGQCFAIKFDEETLLEIQAFYLTNVHHPSAPISNNDSIQTLHKILDRVERLKQKYCRSDHGYNGADNLAIYEKDSKTTTTTEGAPENSMMNIGGDFDNFFKDGSGISVAKSPRGVAQQHQQHYWQFWFWKSDQRYFKWDYGLQKLARTFYSKEKLLHLFAEELLPVNDVVIPSDYSLFRDMIRPKWEDGSNRDGGSWILELERNTTDPSLVQAIWERLAMEIVEMVQYPDQDSNDVRWQHICGLKISMRFKVYMISVWTDCFYDLATILAIGVQMQKVIDNVVNSYGNHQNFNNNDDDGHQNGSVDVQHEDAEDHPELMTRMNMNTNNIQKPILIYRAHKIAQKNAAIKERTKYGYIGSGDNFAPSVPNSAQNNTNVTCTSDDSGGKYFQYF